MARIHQMRQARTDRVSEHDSHLRQSRLEKAADAGDRPASADAANKRPNAPAALFEDFGAGGLFVNERIGGISELLRVEPAALASESGCELPEIPRIVGGRVGRNNNL